MPFIKRYKNYPDHKAYMKAHHKMMKTTKKEELKKITRRYRQGVKMEVFTYYGGSPPKCQCCGESNIKFLTIDHMNNDGAAQRRVLGSSSHLINLWLRKHDFPEGFAIMCYNCNLGRAHNGGMCPHTEETWRAHNKK